MPKKNDRTKQDYSKYAAMTSEELARLLRLDSEAPEGNELDIDTLLYITGVLAEREKTSNNTGKTAQEGWNAFRQNYLDYEQICPAVVDEEKPVKSQKTWLHRIIAAAAALVLVFSIPLTVRALSWEEFCTAVVQWAKETFSFVMGDQQDISIPTKENAHNFSSIQEALQHMQENFNSVPAWIPEGFVLEKVKFNREPFLREYVALYTKGELTCSISVCFYGETKPEITEYESIIDTITSGQNTYYILSNNGQFGATWIQDSCKCCITGDLTADEVKQMIYSIPER